MSATIPHMIAGKAVDGKVDDRFADVFNPATGAVTARVPLASKIDVENRSMSRTPSPWRRPPFPPGRPPHH